MIRRLALILFLASAPLATTQTQRQPAGGSAAKSAADAQLYRSATFRFRYQVRYGWVDRTKEMREQAVAETADSAQGEVLLAVFERPPDAPGEGINSAVVIASESAAAYPKLKKAEDYLEPLNELTAAKGFKADGDAFVTAIDGRQLLRADFIRPLTEKVAMHQSTLVFLAKGKIVSFTFVGGSEDEVEDLIGSLHFFASNSSAP